ncbi:MAG TPA: ribosomal L7Ae/L30e/S12e/Gadd45 family protein [Halanaerobiales bacterium]|nr:ribosomal L7Ae/L30e/S12e/Gadd45 family protein [Halanaerobiales bacterium]
MVRMFSGLKKTRNRVVGTKQTLQALTRNNVKLVFLAEDTDQHLKEEIIRTTRKHHVPVEMVESRLKLGRACGIDVAAACAALLE